MNLNATLSTAVQSLFVSSAEIQTTNNNIANANTPGYTRESVSLSESLPDGSGLGTGVELTGYQSVRDELLQGQIQSQTQSQSGATAELNTMQQVQTVFSSSTSDISTQMSALFSSLSSLAATPSDSSLRQSVLTAGQNLANTFNSASTSLTSLQTSLNSQVTQDVSQINKLTQQIAALNPQIQAAQAKGQGAGTLQDQQDQLVLSLSKLANVSTTKTENGITLTTGNGTPLVVGTNSYALQTTTGTDGMTHVLDTNGVDITSTIQGGDLGGTLQARDKDIPAVLNKLDSLANDVATAFNTAQAKGYDVNGTAGVNFFSIPSTVAGSAAGIKVSLTDPSQIAASSDGTTGSSGNLSSFADIETSKLATSGDTPVNTYANLVYQVGTMVSTANTTVTATTSSLQQLNDQLSSVSGVSIDEESANLIRYQQAYEAAARVVNTVSTLFSVTMNMGDTTT